MTYNGSFTQGVLVSIDSKILKITEPDQEIQTDLIEKIEFIAEEKSSDSAELSANDKLFVGTYQLNVGPHKGTLQFFWWKKWKALRSSKILKLGKGKIRIFEWGIYKRKSNPICPFLCRYKMFRDR